MALAVAVWVATPGYAQQGTPASGAKSSRADNRPLSIFPLRVLWTIPLNNLLAAPPAFDDRRAFFPIEGNRIVAYDLASGARLWIAPIGTTVKPAAGDELVFVVGVDAIEALRAEDGSLAWLLPLADPLAVPLVWDNGWLIAVTIDGAVLALRASDGYLVWRRDIGSPAHVAPSLAADRVYVPTEDGRVVSLRVDTGAIVWERRLGAAPNEILALDDRLYVGSNDNFFYCMDTRNGNAQWAVRTGADVIGLPVIDERRVYFVALDNLLRALGRNTGNLQWKRALSSRPTAGPVEASDVLLVTGLATAVPAYRTADGTPAGDLATGEEIAAPPYVTTFPGVYGPVIVLVTRDMVKGATVLAQARAIEPRLLTTLAPLRNPVTLPLSPKAPSTLEAIAPLPNPTMPPTAGP